LHLLLSVELGRAVRAALLLDINAATLLFMVARPRNLSFATSM
jgi:hypothetical protein